MSGNETKKNELHKTVVVNLRTEEYDVYIGRAGKGEKGTFGNPFDERRFGRDGCIEKFEEYFLRRIKDDGVFRDKVLALKGKRLGCFCKPKQCHGDVIVRWLEEHEEALVMKARAEAAKPSPESIKASKDFHLKVLAMKMTPEGITTEMRTQEQRDHEHSMEKALRTKNAQENIGGNSYD